MSLAVRFGRGVASCTVAAMLITTMPLGAARAGMVSTDRLIDPAPPSAPTSASASDRARVEALLARDDVTAQLIKLGIDPAEAKARVAALTPAELRTLTGQLDRLPAGEGGLELAVIIMSIFLALIILDAFGILNVFNFVCGGINDPCPGQQVVYPQQPPPPPPPRGYYQSLSYYPPPPGTGTYYEELTPRSRVFR